MCRAAQPPLAGAPGCPGAVLRARLMEGCRVSDGERALSVLASPRRPSAPTPRSGGCRQWTPSVSLSEEKGGAFGGQGQGRNGAAKVVAQAHPEEGRPTRRRNPPDHWTGQFPRLWAQQGCCPCPG